MRLSTALPVAVFSGLALAGPLELGLSRTSKPTTPVVPSIKEAAISSQQSSQRFSSQALSQNTVSQVSSSMNSTPEESVPQFDDTKSVESSSHEVPEICSKDSYHVHSQADLDVLSDLCHDFIGSIRIDNYYSPTIDTGDILTIGGDLSVSNATNLVRINLSKLAVIAGTFQLSELTSLTSINAPYLNTVSVIDWRILPILSTINFEQGISDVQSITISDTSMTGFSGFDVESMDILNINNNRFMESITANLRGVNQQLSISSNAKNAVVSLPNLEYANNVTIRDTASLSMQSIEAVNASLELINNNFQAVKFPKLKAVGGTLSLIENYNLRDVDFPVVEDVGGGLMIVNNTMLNKINFLPKLITVGGALEFVGDFKEAAFSKLNLVRGSALIKTISDTFDCSRWIRGGGDQNGTATSIIRGGKIVCTSGMKQQTVKYDQDGNIVDENISFISDEDAQDARQSIEGESSGSAKLTVSSFFVVASSLVVIICSMGL